LTLATQLKEAAQLLDGAVQRRWKFKLAERVNMRSKNFFATEYRELIDTPHHLRALSDLAVVYDALHDIDSRDKIANEWRGLYDGHRSNRTNEEQTLLNELTQMSGWMGQVIADEAV